MKSTAVERGEDKDLAVRLRSWAEIPVVVSVRGSDFCELVDRSLAVLEITSYCISSPVWILVGIMHHWNLELYKSFRGKSYADESTVES